MRILILDACQRASLASVRSLGECGHEIITADESVETLAGSSKFVTASVVYPSPYSDPAGFLEWAKKSFKKLKVNAVLPVTEVTTDIIMRNRAYWPDLAIPFADISKIDRLSNKVELYHLAQSLGVPVPKSMVVNDKEMLRQAKQKIGVPGVLKPARSRVLVNGELKKTVVRAVDSEEGFTQMLSEAPDYYFPALYQEFVPGRGSGVFAVYRHSSMQAYFAHERLREKPPEGGVSVLSESRLPTDKLLSYSKSILDAVEWEGVAMVEFRESEEQGAYLMEINARLWGSLQLAIDAGVDFPALLFNDGASKQGAMGQYKVGNKLRWFLGDLDRLYLLVKNCRKVGMMAVLKGFIAFFLTPFGGSKNEVFRFSDPRPGWFELKKYLRGGG